MNSAFNFSFTFSLCFLWFSLTALSDNSLVINEINYSVKNSDGVEDQGQEWIEIYNTTDQSVSLDGWKITAGVDFEFPNVSVEGKSCLLYTSPSPRDQRGSGLPAWG